MIRLHCFSPGPARVMAIGIAVALAQPVAAQPAGPLPVELQFVPPDAAGFVHVDIARLRGGSVEQALRAADGKAFDEMKAQTKRELGVDLDTLRTVTAFWPKLKEPSDGESYCVVLTFSAPFDKDKFRAGAQLLLPKGTRPVLYTPTDRMAVWLSGLDASYAKPRPADQTGPLAAAIREAGTGTHLFVAGATLANWPEAIRGDDLPVQVRPFQAILKADAVAAVVDVGRDAAVEVRVTAATAPKAVEAEKALGAAVRMLQEALGQVPRELGKGADTDPALKELLAVVKAAGAGLDGAKFTTAGTETRARVTVPADLPVTRALAAATAKVRAAAARTKSQNNLKQIALAMHNYEAANGSFPPAAVCDKRGKPQLSWRVLILPYLEQGELYKQFKLDEPWDGPNNKKLLDKMPNVFAVPVPTTAKPNETHYRVFVGNGAGFDYLRGPKIADFTDGTSNTILVATAADAVPWTKPDELAFDPAKDMPGLLGFFPGEACSVAYCDGSVRALAKTVSKKMLHAVITRGGGEIVEDDAP